MQLYMELHEKIEKLGRKLNNFINSVQKMHNAAMEPEQYYGLSNYENPET
jgi:hypothetical protein